MSKVKDQMSKVKSSLSDVGVEMVELRWLQRPLAYARGSVGRGAIGRDSREGTGDEIFGGGRFAGFGCFRAVGGFV